MGKGIKESVGSPGKESLNAQSQRGGDQLGGLPTGQVHHPGSP